VKLGPAGEKTAARALQRSGYRILVRNFRCPAGEVDLIALDGDTIVFVEVKARRSDRAADPEVNVTRQKRRQVTRAAQYYLMQHGLQNRPCRFDVVAVVLPGEGEPQVEHFVDAFEATSR